MSYAVLADYARQFESAGGRFNIDGIDPTLLDQLRHNRTVERAGNVRIFEATETTVKQTSTRTRTRKRGWPDSTDFLYNGP